MCGCVRVHACVSVHKCELAHLCGCTVCESTGMIRQEHALPACIEACVSLHRHVSACMCL